MPYRGPCHFGRWPNLHLCVQQRENFEDRHDDEPRPLSTAAAVVLFKQYIFQTSMSLDYYVN